MRLKKASSVDYVHQFSDIAFMKFKPKKVIIKSQTQKPEQNLFMSRIKSFINWRSPQTTQSRVSQNSRVSVNSSQASIKSTSSKIELPQLSGNSIIFLQKITSEHFLIGNQNQIDLVCIGGIVGNFIDTESLWELNIGKPIKRIAIDSKKGYIAIETNTEIIVYKYDYKKIRQRPEFVSGTTTKNQGKYLRFIRDSTLAVFYNNFIDIYVVEENRIRKIMCKQFKQAADMILFQVPPAIQNSLNVFYMRKSKSTKTFQLWYIQLNFIGSEAKMTQMMKVYDIKEGLQKKIVLENYSKQVFLMNLGFQILAVKKGYIIDSAYLNIQEESTVLHYIGNNRLLHLSPQKAEIYRFKINFSSNPPRIQINSLDSIQIKKPIDYEYIGALEMFQRNFAVFYQILPHHNRRTKGQMTYCFAITRHVTIEQKVKQIFTFNLGQPLKNIALDLIQERVDMARKIGLNRTQIYLQLWNRTNKSSIQEFKFLLDTLDYETIKRQIQKKLKKSSMLFRQVYKIQQSCFEMIKESLFSSQCTQKVVHQYLTSHFLLRKLQLYRDISVYEKNNHDFSSKNHEEQEQKEDALKINIQNYNRYQKADIKSLFLQLIHQYCFDNKNVLMHIRIFLRSFRFIFRIIYKQLLEDIIITTKSSLIKLLENFPQLLPYKHILMDIDDPSLYEGVWEDISRTQWERNLHIEGISTIDNRQLIAQIPSSLWFRRNFLTQHDMTGKSNEQIIKINKSNNSDDIFYFFISKVFQHITQEQPLLKIIKFVQQNYDKMPQHINQKIFLYRKFFEYFKDDPIAKNNQKFKNFYDLLKMKDYQLFKEFFQFQKIKKGCLLKDIKKIYEQVGGNQQSYILSRSQIEQNQNFSYYTKEKVPPRGLTWFNEGILSYFSSQLSQISDLKYILNRINSQKRQFHAQNENLIYVLVQAVQLKLRIGSERDVPISQVLLYLQNIPISPNNPVLQQLQKIQRINEQSERFQQIKLNMTLAQITQNCETVINALINYEIQKRKVMEVKDIQQMKELSYDIIAEIQIVKEKIYQNQYSDLTFFVYLTKIMEEVHMIPYAAELLQDEYLMKYFSVDLKVVQDLILYMYKLKLSQNSKYIQNEQYLNQLLQILPEDNECRIYIRCQLQYAKILSIPNNPVQYPLTDKSDGISIIQLEQRIQQLPGEFLANVDIEKLHYYMNKMQQICYEDFEENFLTPLNEIYEVIILRLIQENQFNKAIQFTKKLLTLPNNPYGIVFPLFFIDLLSRQLTVQCKKNFLKTVSFLFNQPLQLINIVQELMAKVFTNAERDRYFRDMAIKSSEMKKNYNPKNPILDPIYLQLIRNQQMENNFREMIQQCGHHLTKTKQEFNNFQFSLLFIILTQQPYAIGKYIFCKRYQINYKVMRSFLSYVIKEEIFDSLRVLEFGRRIFNIISEASQSILTLESITSQYSTISIDETIQFQEPLSPQPILPDEDQSTKKAKILYSKLKKCIFAFDKKKSSVLEQIMAKGPQQNIQRKKQRIQKQLTNPIDLSQKQPSEYPFGDSDDDYGQQEKFQDFNSRSIRRRKKTKQFNPSLERNYLINRTTKNYALFMSTQSDHKQDQQMFLSTRGHLHHHKKLKSKKTLGPEGSNSLGMSQNFMLNRISYPVAQNTKRTGFSGGRDTQDINLTESIDGFHHFASKSLVVKNKKRKSSSGMRNDDFHSPQIRISLNDSGQIDQEEEQKVRVLPVISHQNFETQLEIKQRPHSQQQLEVNFQSPEMRSRSNSAASFHVNVQEVDQNQFMSIGSLKKMIIESVSQQNSNFSVDLGQLSLEEDKDNGGFTDYLKSLINVIYIDTQISSKTKLRIIKQIESLYPDIGISKQFLQIYIRFESYHSKYDINIPMSEMFPIQYIFEDAKDPKHLFDMVSPRIVLLVDESNIYKISKIIHLAFKASSFEQQFFFSYLCIAAQKFNNSNNGEGQLNMQYEKLTALIEKLPVHIIMERGYKMLLNMNNLERRQKIIDSMINYVKKKKSPLQVAQFQSDLKNNTK